MPTTSTTDTAPQRANRKDIRTGAKLTSGLHAVTFQHRHFAAVAAILAELALDPVSDEYHAEICRHFADRLARTNPRFDRARFLAAARSTEGR